MTDRSILFSAPMVKSSLAGRKTQTRRVLKTQPIPMIIPSEIQEDMELRGYQFAEAGEGCLLAMRPPFQIKDRLWVREAWRTLHTWDDLAPRHLADDPSKITFEADPENRNPLWAFGKLRPGIFMPRWASRLTLRVTHVRVERLNDISEADAIAEGVMRTTVGAERELFAEPADELPDDMPLFYVPDDDSDDCLCWTAAEAYSRLWDQINGEDAWLENPWVTVTTFDVHRCNIDAMPGGDK